VTRPDEVPQREAQGQGTSPGVSVSADQVRTEAGVASAAGTSPAFLPTQDEPHPDYDAYTINMRINRIEDRLRDVAMTNGNRSDLEWLLPFARHVATQRHYAEIGGSSTPAGRGDDSVTRDAEYIAAARDLADSLREHWERFPLPDDRNARVRIGLPVSHWMLVVVALEAIAGTQPRRHRNDSEGA
jgi:hypothetical protein